MTCSGCRENAKKYSQELYNNVAERIAAEREHQQQLDERRRARREAQSLPTRGGTDASGLGGRSGHGHGPSTLDQHSFEAFDALLAGDAADPGEHDPGEGSSHGSGGGDSSRGGGNSRRGGQRHRE